MKRTLQIAIFLLGFLLPTFVQAKWVDISGNVQISKTSAMLDRVAKVTYSYVKIKNSTGQPITAPLQLIIINPSIQVLNADGLTADFSSYFQLNENLPAGAEKTVRVNFAQARTALNYGVSVQQQAPDINTGVFVDSCVTGLGYRTSSGLQGYTNANCEYQYNNGDSVEFFVGSTSLGSMTAQEILSVLKLRDGAQAAMLLQALDQDKNPDNGITITNDVHVLFKNNTLSLVEIDPDRQEFRQKYKAITGNEFAPTEVGSIAHAQSSVLLEAAKSLEFYKYYTGAIDLYSELPDPIKDDLLSSSDKRLAIYFMRNMVDPTIQLEQIKAFDNYTEADKQNEYAKEVTKEIADFIGYFLVGVEGLTGAVYGDTLGKTVIEVVPEATVGPALNALHESKVGASLVSAGVYEFIFQEISLLNECADVRKLLDPDFSQFINERAAAISCAFAISNAVIVTGYDMKTAVSAAIATTDMNTNIVVKAYLQEYYRTGMRDNFVALKYSPEGDIKFDIDTVLDRIMEKELPKSVEVLGNYISPISPLQLADLLADYVSKSLLRERAKAKINEYKAKVDSYVEQLKSNFSLASNIKANTQVSNLSVDILDGNTQFVFDSNALHVCYKTTNHAYFPLDGDGRFVLTYHEYSSTLDAGAHAAVSTVLKTFSVILDKREDKQICVDLVVPQDIYQDIMVNPYILSLEVAYGEQIATDTQILEASTQNAIAKVLSEIAPPVVEATNSKVSLGGHDFIQLSATGSVDASQGQLSFTWKQILTSTAPAVQLNYADSADAIFAIPTLAANQTQQTLWFKVTATASGSGKETSKIVSVIVSHINPSLSVTFTESALSALGASGSGYSFISGYQGHPAVKFNGGSIRIPNRPEIQFSEGATLDMWVRLDSNVGMDGYGGYVADNGWTMALIAKSHDRTGFVLNMYGYLSQFDGAGSGLTLFSTYDQSWGNCSFASGAIRNPGVPIGEWFRVTATASPVTGRSTYINKQLVSNCTGAGLSFAAGNTQDMYLGKFGDNFWYPFNGAMQDLNIYQQALTDAQVKALP